MTQGENGQVDANALQISLRNAVIDQALDCVVIIDGDGDILEFNPAAEKTFGYEREKVLGLNLADILVPERYRQMHRDGMKRFQETGTGPVIGNRIEIEALCKDGSEIPIELAITPVSAAGEHFFTAYMRDISQRISAENEIRSSQKKYRNLFELSTDAIILHRLDGTIVDVNSRTVSLLGRERDDLIGTHVKELHPPSALAEAKAALADVFDGKDVFVETEFLRADGKAFAAELSASQVETDDGKLVHGVVRDISERKRMAAEQQRNEKLLAHAQRLASVGSFEWTVDSRELLYSEETAAIFGFEPDEKCDRLQPFRDRIHPDERDYVQQAMQKAVDTDGSYEVRHRLLLAGGEIRHLEGRGEVVKDSRTGYRKIVGTVQDITKPAEINEALTHAKEAAEAANVAKSEFLASMSHEMRTPLNGVIGLLDLIGETVLSEEQRFYLEQANSSAGTLLTLLTDLLDLTRIEAGEFAIEKAPMQTSDFVTQSVEVVQAIREGQPPQISVVMEEGVPSRIVGDKARLRQVVTNLLSNAVKFTPNGKIDVNVRYEESTSALHVSVRDQGIGIEAEYIPHLFDRFTQADTGLSRPYGGAGLGLAITKDLVGLMGGEIGVESTFGEGSHFYFFIPAERLADVDQRERGGRDDKPSADALEGLTILLAEDSNTNALVVKRKLGALGAHVDRAANGEEAVSFAASRAYDLILMDVSMPVMDGLEATRTIRSNGAMSAHAPIIALTAHALRGDKERCLEAGMNGYVTKPIAMKDLVAAIAQLTQEKAVDTGPLYLTPDTAATDWEDDQDLFAEVLATFADELRVARDRVENAHKAQDTHGIAEEVHSLKSSAGNVGASPLQELAGRMDMLAKDGRWSELISTVPDLVSSMGSTIDAVEEEQRRMAL